MAVPTVPTVEASVRVFGHFLVVTFWTNIFKHYALGTFLLAIFVQTVIVHVHCAFLNNTPKVRLRV